MEPTIIITRQIDEAQPLVARLKDHDFEIMFLPLIKIEPPHDWNQCDQEIQTIDQYDGIIFTSTHSAHYFLNRAAEISDMEIFKSLWLFAVGEKTKQIINAFQLNCQPLPEESHSEGLVQLIIQSHLSIKKLLLPKSDLADERIDQMLANHHIKVKSIIVCRNVKEAVSPELKKKCSEKLLSNEFKIITFFSPSAINNFLEIFPDINSYIHVIIATIGETTKKAATAKGLQVHIVPQKSTAEFLAQSIIEYVNNL